MFAPVLTIQTIDSSQNNLANIRRFSGSVHDFKDMILVYA